MKNTLFIPAVIALFSFASCNNPAPSGDSTAAKTDSTAIKAAMKAERNKKTAMASEAAINAHDANGVMKDASPDFMEYMDGSMPPQKTDSAKQSLAQFLAAFPDMKAENLVYVADGDNVMVTADWTMTFKNDMGPMKATGKTAKYKDVDIFTFNDDGKMTSHRSIYPLGAMMMMVGVDMSKMQAMMEKDAKKGADKNK